jgi:class 3 adenylate cyclase
MEAEHRQIAVLFTDMVGFTAFADQAGDEAAFGLMGHLWPLMDNAVLEEGGIVQDHASPSNSGHAHSRHQCLQTATSGLANVERRPVTYLKISLSLAIFSCRSAEALKHFYQVCQSPCVHFSHGIGTM